MNERFAIYYTPEVILKEATLFELDTLLGEIYNRRDSIYLPGRDKRINLLDAGIDDLSVAMRKGAPDKHFQELKENLIARVVSRILCVARSVEGLSLTKGLSEKFPLSGCSYCGKMPCECQDRNRSDYKLSDPSAAQKRWTLSQWQSHLTEMYGEKNVENGIFFVIGRLNSELRELRSLESRIGDIQEPIDIETAIQEFQRELSDTMAWTIGAASVIGVDVQKAVVERYGYGCSVCQEKPCRCPQTAHNFKAFNGKRYSEIANGAPF